MNFIKNLLRFDVYLYSGIGLFRITFDGINADASVLGQGTIAEDYTKLSCKFPIGNAPYVGNSHKAKFNGREVQPVGRY